MYLGLKEQNIFLAWMNRMFLAFDQQNVTWQAKEKQNVSWLG